MMLLLLLALLAPSWEGWDRSNAVEESRTFRETIPLEGAKGLTVDNIHGAITVTGDGGNDIRMVVRETIQAADREHLERAKEEASLEIYREGALVLVCANGPFREPDDCTEWRQNYRGRDMYYVKYEITLEVPRSINLTARTIDGDLVVSDIRGRLGVHGVNGSIEIAGAAAPVNAGTVNGPVTVRFLENPREDSDFGTINGDVDVTFPSGMSADLSFDTMNGEVLTDFEHRNLPPVAKRTESRNAGTTYRIEIDAAIRVGSGGPHHRFKNINGDITIRRG